MFKTWADEAAVLDAIRGTVEYAKVDRVADECRAPEGRLLRGTTHVNTVVVARVDGADVPVVVRRRELTRVDYLALDPTASSDGFYHQRVDELGDLVRRLPGHPQLHAILSRRTPTLLHGDLNPWKLVRTFDERFGIGLIGWDRARVGDPLYDDLVRHTCPAVRPGLGQTTERAPRPHGVESY